VRHRFTLPLSRRLASDAAKRKSIKGSELGGIVKSVDIGSRSRPPQVSTPNEVVTFRGSVAGPWARYVTDPDAQGIGTVQYPCLVPKDQQAARELAKRTLTNLYNARPA
jgi:hypothetical protein